MKHSLKITIALITIFFIAQVVGLGVTRSYIDVEKTRETGNLTWKPLLQVGETEVIARPEIEKESSTFIYIIAAILIGTALIFLIIRFKKMGWWKVWYFLAVFVCLSIAFNAFINTLIAMALAVFFALYKLLRPSVIIHNITEIFIYGGLVAIFVPVLNVFWAFMLLLVISVYDMIAVWKSGHMIKLAKAQTEAKVFAGLLIPYSLKKAKKVKKVRIKKAAPKKGVKVGGLKTAILGGGDIGFPLLFAAVVLKDIGFLKALAIPVFVTAALFVLLVLSKKGRFYPAMPFLTAGCIIGYLITLVL
jgi:presenilin-like A22 family membrane protease